jgi:hypothetical protein
LNIIFLPHRLSGTDEPKSWQRCCFPLKFLIQYYFTFLDPTRQDEKERKTNYVSLFKTAYEGGDVSPMIESHQKAIKDSDPEFLARVKVLDNAMVSMISSLTENPTEAEKSLIKGNVAATIQKGNEQVTSQPGLKNALTDEHLMKNPENREFYQLVKESSINQKAVIADPASGYTLFVTRADEMASKCAHYAVVVEDFIKRNKIGNYFYLSHFSGASNENKFSAELNIYTLWPGSYFE